MADKVAVWLSFFVLGLSQMVAQTNEVSFCPAGVQGDGFIDWTKLPRAPTSGSVNATLRVSGVANLFATFQVPPSSPTLPGAYYTVDNPSVLTLAQGVNPTVIFDRPVRGISVTFQSSGRFGHDFKMTAYSSTGAITLVGPPPDAQVDSNGFDYPAQQFSTSPLQIRSSSANLVAVTFQFNGNDQEYDFYRLINFRVESGSGPDLSKQIPKNSLKEWLRADRVNFLPVPINAGTVVTWPDQSGNGSDAAPPTFSSSPNLLLDAPDCTPVVSFSGSQQLRFNLPINGWSGMTVFLAAQSYADSPNQALFWNETARWGATFLTPSQNHVFFRFGTTQVNNQPVYTRPVDIGGDFSITTAIHNTNTDSLYVNGLLVLQQGGKYPTISGTAPTATIGAGTNNMFFAGNIGEILIYDRALSTTEREVVEHYLMTKYGIF